MSQSYFALLDLEARFSLGGEQLDAAYRALAAQVHPDRHANASPTQRRQALQLATMANEAYRTLKRPVLRARHLLNLRGMDVPEQSAAMSPTFLMQQMTWREALQETQAARDTTALDKIDAQVRGQAAALRMQLAQQLDVDHDNAAAVRTVGELMFIDKLLADIDAVHAAWEI